MGLAHALHSAAFLVDQDRCIGAANGLAKLIRQALELIPIADIALEQDQTPGIRIGKKGLLVRSKLKT